MQAPTWGQFVKTPGSTRVKSAKCCGRQNQHFYELYLGSQNIEHRVTKPASPYANGFVERFHRTLNDEFFAKAFREKIYSTLEVLQKELDGFLAFYNEEPRCKP
jgi:transposase InsO family protein